MMRTLLYSCLFLSLLICSCTSKIDDKKEAATNDSIQKYLDLAKNDTLDIKLRNKYNDKAYTYLDLSKNDTLTRYYLASLTFNYLNVRNWNSLKKIAKIHFDKSFLEKDTLNLARYYLYKGDFFRKLLAYDSSFYYYIKAEKLFKGMKNEAGIARIHYYKSTIQLDINNYLDAEFSSNVAYNYCKNKPISRFTLQVLTIQGAIAHNLKEYEKAIKKYKECINVIEKYNLQKTESDFKRSCLNNIGNAYREEKKFHEAISYFKLVLKERKLKEKDCELYALSLNNIGYCYMQLNNNKELPGLFFKAGKILDSIGNKNEYVVSNLFISQFYLKQKDTLKAKLYADTALKTAKKTNAAYYYLTALSNAGYIDIKNAPKYIKEYHEKNDSLVFIERNSRNQYYKIQFETANITQEREAAIKQNWLIGVISAIVIVIIILLLIISRQRYKQRQLRFLQLQQKANEEIYDLMLSQKSKEEDARQSEKKRIALELHDGIMNRLSSTRLNLNILSQKSDKETIDKCLNYVEGIYQIEQEIRHIAHDLNLDVFSDINSFTSLLIDFISTQNNITDTCYVLEIDKSINWHLISSSIKMNVFRIIQEASQNINKFACAKNAVISFILDENNLCLSIWDNGKGFQVDEKSDGIGLKNIKKRVESLNGKLVIQSINNDNTTLNIAIPVTS